MRHKVLFVLTSTASLGKSGEPTGLWLEEFTVPYVAISAAGYGIDIASTAGGPIPIDPRSVCGDAYEVPENRRYQDDRRFSAVLRSSRAVGQIRFSDYDGIFLPGGHGTLWDLPKNEALARGIVATFMAGKPVAAVCHGPAGLIGAKLADGRPLVAGRWVASFTTPEEIAIGLKDKVPFLLDAALASLGARLVSGERFTPIAVAHDNLITGQNPKSAREVAGLMIAALQRQSAYEPTHDVAA